MVKIPPANTGNADSIPRSGKSFGEENDSPLQLFLLGKSHGHRSLMGYRPRGLKRVRHTLETKMIKTTTIPLCHSQKHKVSSLSCVWLVATPWSVAHQAPLSVGFSRQEYWSGLPFPSPGDLSNPGDWTQVSHIAGRCFKLWATREAPGNTQSHTNGNEHFAVST